MGTWKCAESWVIAVLLLMTTIHHFNLLTFLPLISRLSGCCLSSTHSGSKQRHVLELQKSYFQQKLTCVGFSCFFLLVCLFCGLLIGWGFWFTFLRNSFSFTCWFYLSISFFNFLLQFHLCHISMISGSIISILEIQEMLSKGS